MPDLVQAIPISDLPVVSLPDLSGDELLLLRDPTAPTGTQTKLIPLSVLSAYIGANFVVPSARQVATGGGLAGGGTLEADRTLTLDPLFRHANGAIYPAILSPASAPDGTLFRNSSNSNRLTYKTGTGSLVDLGG